MVNQVMKAVLVHSRTTLHGSEILVALVVARETVREVSQVYGDRDFQLDKVAMVVGERCYLVRELDLYWFQLDKAMVREEETLQH